MAYGVPVEEEEKAPKDEDAEGDAEEPVATVEGATPEDPTAAKNKTRTFGPSPSRPVRNTKTRCVPFPKFCFFDFEATLSGRHPPPPRLASSDQSTFWPNTVILPPSFVLKEQTI